jgi:mRNA interferase HigB
MDCPSPTARPAEKADRSLFPNWEQAILNRAGDLGENLKDFLATASGCRRSAESVVYRDEESSLEWPPNHQSCVSHGQHSSEYRVVFNIKGNTYRLFVAIKYEFQVVYIRFIGTHAEYDKIKAEEV